ncbi:hypothetical protein ACNOYE_37665 [Nannocystaceae bacterium ST9]
MLGVAALIVEILTGRPFQAGAPIDRYGLPPRLARVLAVAAAAEPDDRPKDILMFSRRLQAAVGLGEDPTEPSAVLEPVSHGEHADPRYPAVRAQPWRPPPPPPPPWAARATSTPGSGAWNVGAPVPGSGAWNVGAPVPGSGAWPLGGATPTTPSSSSSSGSGGWSLATRSGPLQVPPLTVSSSSPPATPPKPPPRADAPSLGRDFPKAETMPSSFTEFGSTGEGTFDLPPPKDGSEAAAGRAPAKTKVFAGPPPPGPGSTGATRPPPPPPSVGSVSIVMPAPDGSVLAAIAKGPRDYWILRRGKAHGPYDLGQLERLIPMGKLLSVDAIQLESSGEKVLAVDLPGLRPLFEAKARETEPRPAITTPPSLPAPVAPAPAGRGALWVVVGLLVAGLIAAGAFVVLGQ